MKLIDDFKAFALKGNVLDLAIGIIIGAAFGKTISSLVSDIIMPPLGLLIGGINFVEFKFVIKHATLKSEAIAINYGNFLQNTFDFLVVSFAIFLVIKAMNSSKKKEEVSLVNSNPTKEEILLTEIRDLLKKQN